MHLSDTDAEVEQHDDDPRPETQDQDHRTEPTGEVLFCFFLLLNIYFVSSVLKRLRERSDSTVHT